jgi:hypothetical protein
MPQIEQLPEALPVLALAAVAVLAVVALVAVVVLFHRREDGLRSKLGSCRTSLQWSEGERARIVKLFNAQAVELARYRQQHRPSDRLTRVFTGLPEPKT